MYIIMVVMLLCHFCTTFCAGVESDIVPTHLKVFEQSWTYTHMDEPKKQVNLCHYLDVPLYVITKWHSQLIALR